MTLEGNFFVEYLIHSQHNKATWKLTHFTKDLKSWGSPDIMTGIVSFIWANIH